MNQLVNILNQSISLFVLIPLVAFLASLFWKNKEEKPIARIVLFTKAFYIVAAAGYALLWILSGAKPVSYTLLTLYETNHFVFALQFYYDHITLVYSLVGAILFFLVSTFSRYYMHRDEGYKRFFNTILFFALGYNIIIFSGNFETLFIGWEIIGLSSFLLIAFYRKRYLPVKNAFKTISNYRVSDVALMLAMWMLHHFTHQNISFEELESPGYIAVTSSHPTMAVFITIMFLLAAMIKSAQVPFTTWLPRAMEGPTSSSAIFYGSLSVHIGVFLLLRTWPFWSDQLWAKIVIVAAGAITAVIASLIARVQPTVKTQIAYSSAAQIGLIFIEVALGLHILALIHFAGNAFLRTYQLLVSPSVLNYLVHHQYFHYQSPKERPVSRFRAALYILSIKEWNFDTLIFTYLWSPFKWIGKKLKVLQTPAAMGALLLAGAVAVIADFAIPGIPAVAKEYIAAITAAIALGLILFSFAHRGSAIQAWLSLLTAHIFIMAAITMNTEHINITEIIFYATGVLAAFAIGYYCLYTVKTVDNDISLGRYHGYVYELKNMSFLFLIAVIGLLGFPVTAAFIGVDVMFTYVGSGQAILITLLALCFIFIELAAIRIFCRIFLGPSKKLNHPVAFRSS
jgi:NADH:ubiquinone oxidoreductase subunit 5 (subunit L)/multisubunit Na+/H+ antiporter MnhA subunit